MYWTVSDTESLFLNASIPPLCWIFIIYIKGVFHLCCCISHRQPWCCYMLHAAHIKTFLEFVSEVETLHPVVSTIAFFLFFFYKNYTSVNTKCRQGIPLSKHKGAMQRMLSWSFFLFFYGFSYSHCLQYNSARHDESVNGLRLKSKVFRWVLGRMLALASVF